MVTFYLISLSNSSCTVCLSSNMLKFLCPGPPKFAVVGAIPEVLLSPPRPILTLPDHFRSLFTKICSQVMSKDSNPAAICIDLDTKGTALFTLAHGF